jgi:hypothetical protein
MLKGETPAEALEAIAKAAGAYVHKIDAKRYEIRSQPPTGDSGAPAPAAEPPPLPEWAKAMKARLAGATMPGAFAGTPLETALAAIARAAGVPIVLDPEVRKLRSEQDLTVDVHVTRDLEDPFGKPAEETAQGMLDLVLLRPRLTGDYRWRCVYVSTAERLAALPVAVAAAKDGGEDVKRILAEKAVTVKLAKASLKKAVQTLKEKGGLPIRLDPAAEKAVAGRTFDADLADVPLGEALGAIFLPRGFDVAAEEAGLVVRPLP